MVEEKPDTAKEPDYEEANEDLSEGEFDLQAWRKEQQRH